MIFLQKEHKATLCLLVRSCPRRKAMKTKARLGRGIDALFSDQLQDVNSHVIEISSEEIYPNPIQPRKAIDPEALNELSESIRKHGLISPIVVRRINSKYEIIAGERRFHACKHAGIDNIPAIIREMSDRDAFKVSLIENLQREDLNPMEEAEAYQTLKEHFQLTHQDIASAVFKDRSTITNALRLVGLPEDVKCALRDGSISTGHARAILMADGERDRVHLLEKVLSAGLSVRETERLASHIKNNKRKKHKKDPHLDSLSSFLSERLAARVTCSWAKRKGKITIDITSREDFDRIVNLFSHRELPV
ncbi:MAG TPA: ParB/RepB/Spo0J family partition protein [Deltaproteobacteria bacterium]|nr:ParB/RepB/Spo0J family partition protein [Deltaproteobacteria bacterium]